MIDRNTTNNVKALAIIMVMLGHLIGAKKIDVNIAWLDIATFGVSLFLFISGYGLYKSYESKGLNGFFRSKIHKVYIPFAIATILIGMSRGFFSDKWTDIVKTILFSAPSLPIDGTMWYIYYIALWYVIFYVVFSLLKTNPTRLTALVFISISIS
uniref:acyltransferase family protein n=1 Tax=Yersinia rochesterensis TaxID=1604335 RepID=UPI0011A8F278